MKTYTVMTETHRPDGQRVVLRRRVQAATAVAAVRRALDARSDQGAPFLGCVVKAQDTTTGDVRRYIVESRWGVRYLDPVRRPT